ncbi:hypothetical protein AXF19_01855 [Selenomonas sp. oral taxon 126]|uniref:autotransporter outer membrane beta-barrel domain-containing protein n=1 Tax=Selenomonas sp. oral taxon 126 TaxID=712528 RepID=UPI00080779EB|nr:autotransporter outer membrane beta-barrel domain-containing protein [Selenomonas sp. oral taxon 126]ANR69860.1 hypothetical protein AXF19_01855 [Selenomonas sp. oral taxon 126]
MFKEIKSRRLALLVAIALGGGGFLSSAQNVSAADVTGRNVTIDDTQAPSNNAEHPGGGASIGTAAGFIKDEHDNGNVKDNTLTFKNLSYTNRLYGGLTFGKGNVTGNKVFVNSATSPLVSTADSIYGGSANGGGNVEDNHATFNGNHLNGDLVGGMATDGGTGTVKKNTATLKGGNVHGNIYGGTTDNQANGDVLENEVLIEGGTVTGTGNVYGGYTDQNSNVKGNIVTIKGGVLNGIYGGYSSGTGEVSGNTVNLGDGTSAMKSGYAINGKIIGGRSIAHPEKVSNNTLNVNTNATAYNIENFETINFNFNAHMNTSNPLLTLTDSGKTKLKSLSQINVNNAAVGGGTLIENTHGIDVDNSADVGRTADKTETIIKKHTAGDKIIYRTYQFKNATEKDTDGTATWGGRSLIGNTTTKNEITLTGNHGAQSVYGGWTSGMGSTATGEKAKNHSIDNKITFNGAPTDTVNNMFGGLTVSPGGNATGNRAVLQAGKVTGSLNGGSVGATGGSTTRNFVEINGGEVGGATYGGYTSSTGKAEENEVTITNGTAKNLYGGFSENGSAEGNKVFVKGGTARNVYGGKASHGNVTKNTVEITGGTVTQSIYGGEASGSGKVEYNTVTLASGTTSGDIFGGLAYSGDATKNIVNINGGDLNNHDVYGAWTTSGNATGNTVTIKGNGGTVQNITGGRSNSGNATGNTVNLGDGTSDFTTGITGTISGGNGATVGKDYLTDNTLNVYDNVQATNISNFATINFRFNQYVTKTDSFLRLTDTGVTTIRSLNDLHLHGEHGHKGTLIEKTGAGGTIDIADGQNRLAKTEDAKESVFAKSSDGKKVTYESYTFKGATTPTTDDGGTYKDIFGGRSILGNTTTENVITVSDAVTYRNAYGGWTSGTGTTLTEKGNSIANKITVASTVTDITGTVYGGFTDVTGGNATKNEVTIEKSITGAVVGGKALGDASGNTVTVKANTGAVTGGEGATTNNNTVNLEGGVTVNGAVKGGTQANGTDNTLNVKGQNFAQSVEGFQKMNFNTNGVAAGGTMLNVTGGAQTKVNWNTLTVDGNGRGISLLKNNNGIDFGGTYTDGAVKSGLSADQKSEMNVSVSSDKKEIKYTGYQFTGVTTASVDGTKAYGGISKAGNATHHNNITVNGNYTEVYGGHTSGTSNMGVEQKNSHDNTVTITGGMLGKVYGGYTDAADGTTENNTVNLGDGTNPLAPGSTVAEIHGGNKSAKGNTLNVNTAATVGKIENFSTVAFKNAASKLTLTQAGANFDLDTIKADFAATENEDTLVENANGLTLKDNKTFRTALSTDGTKETNIEARNGNKEIVRYGYTFKGATTVTTRGTEMWGGRSAAGNSTYDNKFTVNDGSGKTVYGGYTTGANGTATDKNDSHTNEVTLTGGTNTNVYGGWTNVGKAVSNTVNVTGNATGSIVGGYSASGEASNNVVSVMNAAFTGDITGGQGAVTNYNVIRLRNASVTGTIKGGTATNGVDNTLAVSYGSGASSSVGDITNVQRLHFDMENAPVRNANPLLKLTNVNGGDKNLTGMKFAVARSGATKKLAKGDTFTLMENTTTGGHNITVGSGVTAEGRDGVSRKYEFAVHQDPNNAHKLVATVTKVGFAEQAKSLVETRAGASAFLNDGADFLAGAGMNAAQKEARAAAMTGSAPYGIWAGMGAGSLRHKTGSYVDMKGWNLGVGWARENAVKEGTLTFGPFIEYGRGSYDSYLDDGTHGNGKTSYIGAGVMAKLETKANNWIDGSLRVGRTKSDYTGLDTSYDTTSTYYAMHVGMGKDFHVREGDTVSAYVRYSYAHTAGTSAHLSSGETYDFDAVNSHRLRIGTRYTHGETALSQLYAGLAWEYEFDGDARATYDGDSTPSPSLKGGSALLELGYRFAPKADSRVSYDLNLNGWQGKRQGVTGGVSVKWAF